MNSKEQEKWENAKKIMIDSSFVLPPYMSYLLKNDFKKVSIDLSRYKFVGKLLEGKENVLEVGCNDGLKSLLLLQFVKHIVGIDFDEEAISIAKKRFLGENADFRYGDFLNVDKIGVFDACVSLDVIEHIPKEKEDVFMKNICNNLSKHGVAVIGTPNITAAQYQSEISRMGHINMFSYDRLKSLGEKYFHNVFLFGANDEIVHTGFAPMAHYLFIVCTGPRL